jgi:hypothetical protein
MKRISLLVAIVLTVALRASVFPQTRQTVDVTSRTVATQPAGTPYTIDLTQGGKVYRVSPDVASRVQVVTSTGKMSLSNLASRLRLSGGEVLLGSYADLSAINFGFTLGGGTVLGDATTSVKCDGTVCSCSSKNGQGRDCSDMGKANVCVGGANRNWWACDKSGCACLDKKGM